VGQCRCQVVCAADIKGHHDDEVLPILSGRGNHLSSFAVNGVPPLSCSPISTSSTIWYLLVCPSTSRTTTSQVTGPYPCSRLRGRICRLALRPKRPSPTHSSGRSEIRCVLRIASAKAPWLYLHWKGPQLHCNRPYRHCKRRLIDPLRLRILKTTAYAQLTIVSSTYQPVFRIHAKETLF
jgi:hypothetical protein